MEDTRERVIALDKSGGEEDLEALRQRLFEREWEDAFQAPCVPLWAVVGHRPWVEEMERGDMIYLVKEQQLGTVLRPWEVDEATGVTGFLYFEDSARQPCQWAVDRYGRGLDHKPLVLPCVPWGRVYAAIVEKIDRRVDQERELRRLKKVCEELGGG